MASYQFIPLDPDHPYSNKTKSSSYAQWANKVVNFYEGGTGLNPCTLDVWDTPLKYGTSKYSYSYNHTYPTLTPYSLTNKYKPVNVRYLSNYSNQSQLNSS